MESITLLMDDLIIQPKNEIECGKKQLCNPIFQLDGTDTIVRDIAINMIDDIDSIASDGGFYSHTGCVTVECEMVKLFPLLFSLPFGEVVLIVQIAVLDGTAVHSPPLFLRGGGDGEEVVPQIVFDFFFIHSFVFFTRQKYNIGKQGGDFCE